MIPLGQTENTAGIKLYRFIALYNQNNQNNIGTFAIMHYLNSIKHQNDTTLGGPSQTSILFVKFAIM